MVGITFFALFFITLGIMMWVKYHSPEYQQTLARRRQVIPFYSPNLRPPISPELRNQVKRRFAVTTSTGVAYGCAYCGRIGSYTQGPDGSAWEIDHVVPYSRGGPTVAGNLVLACRSCNQTKGANAWQVTYPNSAALAAHLHR